MDHRRFDRFARLLAGASTRRAALAALLALAGGGALDAGAKRRRNRCDPPCPAGQRCVKGACACDDGGTVCGAACCAAGQACTDGACVDPPPQCLAFGATCKNAGVPCCDGLVCGSGPGGLPDVACYVPAGGPCQSTSECVFGSACTDGACVAIPQPPPGPTCAPSFPVTGDPGANGLALQAAVDAAADGATIVLAPGEYRFGIEHHSADAGLQVADKTLAIEACHPGADVRLVCPDAMPYHQRCVVVGRPAGTGSLTVRGLTIDHQMTGESPVMAVLTGATATIEATTLQTTSYDSALVTRGPVRIGPGVTLRNLGSGSPDYAMRQGPGGVITCDVPPASIDFASRCAPNATMPGCDCG